MSAVGGGEISRQGLKQDPRMRSWLSVLQMQVYLMQGPVH